MKRYPRRGRVCMYSGLTDLGTVDGDPCSDALAVSSNGQVVGASQSAAGGCGEWTTAFLWENGGPTMELMTASGVKTMAYLSEAGGLPQPD